MLSGTVQSVLTLLFLFSYYLRYCPILIITSVITRTIKLAARIFSENTVTFTGVNYNCLETIDKILPMQGRLLAHTGIL